MISLEALYVLCRFLHFVVVMLMFGFSLFTTLLASGHFLILIKKRLRDGLAIGVNGGWLARRLSV